MAGPIKISVLADMGQAVKEITRFSDVVDSETKRVVTSLGDSKLSGGFGKVQEGFDVMDTRAMGFRDTITGVQDTMTAFQALTTSTADAQARYNTAVQRFGKESQEAKAAQEALEQTQKSLGDKILLLGMGVGDLASGFANFIVPLVAVGVSMQSLSLATVRAAAASVAHRAATVASAVASGVMTAAQWALNAAMSANPIGIIIIAIVALVAAIVLAYKNSETFRAVVQAVWAAIKTAVSAVINWLTTNIPKIWESVQAGWERIRSTAETAWNAVRAVVATVVTAVVGHFKMMYESASTAVRNVISFVTSIPGKVASVFSGAGTLLWDAGSRIINGLWDGLKAKWESVKQWFSSVTSSIKDLKGPPARDAELLRRNGQLVIEGFLSGLESRYGMVRDSLRGLTTDVSLAGAPAAAGAAGGGTNVTSNVYLDGQPFYAMTHSAIASAQREQAWTQYAGRRL